MTLTDKQRANFAKKHPVRGEDECWEWTGGRGQLGYGMFGVTGRVSRAHRVAWEIHKGEIPEGLCVLHHCDNPECVNPDHLWLGTNADNSRNMAEKGRSVKGRPGPMLSGAIRPTTGKSRTTTSTCRWERPASTLRGIALPREAA